MMFIFNISPEAGVVTLIVFALIIAYRLKGKFPLGCAVVCIAFVWFTVKTCRELDEEEAAEQQRSEKIWKEIQEDKRLREERKKGCLLPDVDIEKNARETVL